MFTTIFTLSIVATSKIGVCGVIDSPISRKYCVITPSKGELTSDNLNSRAGSSLSIKATTSSFETMSPISFLFSFNFP